jgi:hypothetical protein
VIWRALREVGSPESAAGAVGEVFGIPKEQALGDVQAAIRDWVNAGLLGPLKAQSAQPSRTGNARTLEIARCSIQDVSYRLLTDLPEAVDEIAPRLCALSMANGEAEVELGVYECAGRVGVFAGDTCISIEDSIAAARVIVLQEMVRLAQRGREWLTLLHAGACGKNGRCVLFPAASHSGKTTLTARLHAAGFEVYSDDFAGVQRSDLRIPAMPFAMVVREGSWPVIREFVPGFDRIGERVRFGQRVKFLSSGPGNVEPAEAVAMVVTRWDAGAPDAEMTALSAFEMLLRISAAGFWISPDAKDVGTFLAWLNGLPKFELVYSDVSQAVEQFARLMEFRSELD